MARACCSSSAASFAQATWVHLRLDVIVNTNGDVVLKVFQNDLALHAARHARPTGSPSPAWSSSSTTTSGINSGSQPLTSGRGGFGCSVRDVTRRCFFDHARALPAGVTRWRCTAFAQPPRAGPGPTR
jgi:hypothetical protein